MMDTRTKWYLITGCVIALIGTAVHYGNFRFLSDDVKHNGTYVMRMGGILTTIGLFRIYGRRKF